MISNKFLSLLGLMMVILFLSSCSIIDPEKLSGIQELGTNKTRAEQTVKSASNNCKLDYNDAQEEINTWVMNTVELEIAVKESEFFSKIDLSKEILPTSLTTSFNKYMTCALKEGMKDEDQVKNELVDEILKVLMERVSGFRKKSAKVLRVELKKLLWLNWEDLRK